MPELSQKLEFSNDRGDTLAARLELPDGEPCAFAIFAHCFTCSKDIAAASRISRGLRGRQIAVLRFDFTGLGNSDGDFANTNFSSNIADLLAAADHLRQHYEAPQLLIGHSLGGAAVLAARAHLPEVKAVATIGAPSAPQHVQNLLQDQIAEITAQGHANVRLGGRDFRIEKQFLDDLAEQNLPQQVQSLGAALLIFHSPLDETVSIDHARQLYEAARHPKSFISLDQADHLLTRPRDSEYVSSMLAAWAGRYFEPKEQPESPGVTADPLPAGVVEIAPAHGKFGHTVRSGAHTLIADEPTKYGGDDRGPGPYDLLLASLGACTSMTMRMYADRKEWPFEGARILLKHSRIHAQDCEECESETGKIDRIEKEVELLGDLDAEQRARLLEIADRCPVHRTLLNEKQIITNEVRA